MFCRYFQLAHCLIGFLRKWNRDNALRIRLRRRDDTPFSIVKHVSFMASPAFP